MHRTAHDQALNVHSAELRTLVSAESPASPSSSISHSGLSLTPLTAFSSGYVIVIQMFGCCLEPVPGLEDGTCDMAFSHSQLPWHEVFVTVSGCCSASVVKGVAQLLRGQRSESHRKPRPCSGQAPMRQTQPLWLAGKGRKLPEPEFLDLYCEAVNIGPFIRSCSAEQIIHRLEKIPDSDEPQQTPCVFSGIVRICWGRQWG